VIATAAGDAGLLGAADDFLSLLHALTVRAALAGDCFSIYLLFVLFCGY